MDSSGHGFFLNLRSSCGGFFLTLASSFSVFFAFFFFFLAVCWHFFLTPGVSITNHQIRISSQKWV